MNASKMELSVIIIAKNEEKKLTACLESARGFSDIVLVDNGSSDRTGDIARDFGARVYPRSQSGDFAALRNYGAGLAANDIVLQLDADERLTPELIKEIASLDSGTLGVAAIPRRNRIAGRWLRGGGFAPRQDTQTRLYDRRAAHWNGLVHEMLSVAPSVLLKNALIHDASESFKEAFANFESWTTLSAQDRARRGKRPSWFRLVVWPMAEFIRRYLLLGGFIDGWTGFRLALRHAYGKYVIERKLRAYGQV